MVGDCDLVGMDQRLAGKAVPRPLRALGVETCHIVEPVAHAIEPGLAPRSSCKHDHLQRQFHSLARWPRLDPGFGSDVIRACDQPGNGMMSGNLASRIKPGRGFDHRQQRRAEIAPDPVDGGRSLDLGQHKQVGATIAHCLDVIIEPTAVGAVDSDRQQLSRRASIDILPCRNARIYLVLDRDRIFQIDNQHIGVQPARLLQRPRVRPRHVERGASELQICSNVYFPNPHLSFPRRSDELNMPCMFKGRLGDDPTRSLIHGRNYSHLQRPLLKFPAQAMDSRLRGNDKVVSRSV